jgi:Zn-dependent oligopeptidase
MTSLDRIKTAEAADALDDDLTKAVERAYATRLTAGTDLSEDEKKRIQEKQSSRGSDNEGAAGD